MLFTRFHIPDLDGIVSTGTRNPAPIPLPTDPQHMMRMSLESPDQLAGFHLELLHKFVSSPRNQILSITRKIDAEDRVTVSVNQLPPDCASLDIPQNQFAAS